MQGYREQQKPSYGALDSHSSSESIQVPEYMMGSRPTSVESLTEVTDAANSSAPTSSANSSVSNISMERIRLANSLNSARALFKKKSLVQLVNSYIKAGIEEGTFPGRTFQCSTSMVKIMVARICIAWTQFLKLDNDIISKIPLLSVRAWKSFAVIYRDTIEP